MTQINPAVLMESHAARQLWLSKISNKIAIELLNKIKKIDFHKWEKKDFVTVAEISDYYEIGAKEVRSYFNRRNYWQEFKGDGVETVHWDKAKEVNYARSKSSSSQKIIIVPPIAAIRLGILVGDENSIGRRLTELLLHDHSIQNSKDIEGSIEIELQLELAKEKAATSQLRYLQACEKLGSIDLNLLKMILNPESIKSSEVTSSQVNDISALPMVKNSDIQDHLLVFSSSLQNESNNGSSLLDAF